MLEHFARDTFLTRKIFFISCLWCSLVVIPFDVVLYICRCCHRHHHHHLCCCRCHRQPCTKPTAKETRKNLVNHAHVSEQVFHKSFRLLLVFSYWDFFALTWKWIPIVVSILLLSLVWINSDAKIVWSRSSNFKRDALRVELSNRTILLSFKREG